MQDVQMSQDLSRLFKNVTQVSRLKFSFSSNIYIYHIHGYSLHPTIILDCWCIYPKGICRIFLVHIPQRYMQDFFLSRFDPTLEPTYLISCLCNINGATLRRMWLFATHERIPFRYCKNAIGRLQLQNLHIWCIHSVECIRSKWGRHKKPLTFCMTSLALIYQSDHI